MKEVLPVNDFYLKFDLSIESIDALLRKKKPPWTSQTSPKLKLSRIIAYENFALFVEISIKP